MQCLGVGLGWDETDLADAAQITVKGIRRMQKLAADGEAVHGGFDLLRDLGTLADPTDDQLAVPMDGACDDIDRGHEALLRDGIGVEELPHVAHRVSGRGDDMEAGTQGGFVARRVEHLVRIGRGHGKRRNGLADMRQRGREEGRDGRERLVAGHIRRHGRPGCHGEALPGAFASSETRRTTGGRSGPAKETTR